MASSAFLVAERVLCVKRRSFCNKITEVSNKAKSEAGLSKEGFYEKKIYFEQHWGEIVNATKGCVGLINDGDDDKDEQVTELNYHIEMLKVPKEQLLSFEIERRSNMVDVKNVESTDGNTSQDGRT